jgi:hypothetical protein
MISINIIDTEILKTMDLSLEELERLVNEKRRRLELLQQLLEID